MAERTYCSEVAQAHDVSLAGTAVQVDLWLLIEYSRPWKPKAILDNELSQEIREHLSDLAVAAEALGRKLRVQFIKQSTSDHREKPKIFLIDGRVNQEQGMVGDLPNFDALLQLTADQLCDNALPQSHSPQTLLDPIYLVCTNGQRDLCCARFGLPLYEALRMEYGDAIWQTTHIGGHRYAPNLLCLPSGLVYGFVSPDTGVEFIEELQAGAIKAERLRGRSCYTKEMQAAEALLALQGKESLQFSACVEVESGYQIDFTGERTGQVTIARESLPPAIASCGAEPKPDDKFTLQTVQYDQT